MCGDEGALTFYLSQSKNVLKDGYIQVHMGDTHKS